MAKQTKRFILLIIPLFLLCETAYANAGTPLMWAGMLHLAFGNLAIGLAEGLLLGFIFRLPKLKSIGMMILANYISAWLGYLILKSLEPLIERSITIYQIQAFIWIAYGIAFAFTLIAELPFIYILMRHRKDAVVRTLIASFVIQSLSYCGIFYWYWTASFDSLLRKTQIVRSFESQHPESMLYFLGDDQNVYQMRLDGSQQQEIYTPNEKQEWQLYLKETEKGIDLCIISLDEFFNDERNNNSSIIKNNIISKKQKPLNLKEHAYRDTIVLDYRPQEQSEWLFRVGFWAAEGLELSNTKTEQRYSIALETPFAQWYVRSGTVLPGDEVVFQLGNQICLFSRPTHKLTLLTRGTSPVVIFNNGLTQKNKSF